MESNNDLQKRSRPHSVSDLDRERKRKKPRAIAATRTNAAATAAATATRIPPTGTKAAKLAVSQKCDLQNQGEPN